VSQPSNAEPEVSEGESSEGEDEAVVFEPAADPVVEFRGLYFELRRLLEDTAVLVRRLAYFPEARENPAIIDALLETTKALAGR
jgi:hypothetical protein